MNSKFSDFFRNATYEEKERLWKEIARKACEEQLEVINQAKQMNEKKILCKHKEELKEQIDL